jgi:hypothetical protein
MDHADARVRLIDLVLDPARLRGFDRDVGPESSELREHVATCADCQAELEAWRATVAALDAAVSADLSDGDVPVRSLGDLAASAATVALPAGLRARALAAGQDRPSSPVPHVAARRRMMRPLAWLAVAAVFLVFLSGAFLVVDRTQQLDQAQADAAALETLTASLDRILQDPGHEVAVLRTPAGTPAGSVSWSTSEGTVVVLAGTLQSPPAGQVYRCWIEQGGTRLVVGEMRLRGSIAYWAGSFGSWAIDLDPVVRFGVSLEPVVGGSSGAPVLVGTL